MRKNLMIALMMAAATSMVETTTFADPVGGRVAHCSRIGALGTRNFEVQCYGGEATAISIEGDGDTNLDVYVYDKFGNLLAYDESRSGDCFVAFVPPRTGAVTIQIVNQGLVYNDFCFLAY